MPTLMKYGNTRANNAEGPVWWKEGGYLLFSDINGNRRMKYTPGQGTVEFKKPTNGANGLTRDLQGRGGRCPRKRRSRRSVSQTRLGCGGHQEGR
jgi:sugar lactone lactonase YvrE